jgi:hypothetical protein
VGEVQKQGQLYQRQVAPTLAALLGLSFKPAHPVPAPVTAIFKKE